MNILIISRGYPCKGDPIYGIFESDQAKALVKLGHKVVVLCIDRRFHAPIKRKIGITKDFVDNICVYKMFVAPLPINIGLSFTSFIASLAGSFLFERIKKECGLPDIIHAHYLFSIPIAVKIGHKYNIPVVATEHWSVWNAKKLPREALRLAKKYYPKIDSLISVSEALQQAILEKAGYESLVINNIVDTEYYNYVENSKAHSDKFVFLSVGTLIKRKGFDLLIKAFKNANFSSEVSLIIRGDGPEYDSLFSLVTELQLENRIQFVGKISRDEMKALFNGSSVYVQPSRFETFGVVFIEALACGLPVIATICGGPENFITPEDGILIPTDDVDALTKSMIEIRNNASNYNSKAISERCISKFSPNVIAQQIVNVYNKILVEQV